VKKTLSLALGLVLVALIAVWVAFSPARVITEVQLNGDLERLKPTDIEQMVSPYVGQSFWRIDLERLHADILHLDWVYKVKVKRRWPNKLILEITEQKPVVRWGDDGLLNQEGDIFYPYNIEPFQRMVVLDGEAIQSRALLQKLTAFQNAFSTLGWTIDAMTAQADGVWRIHFLSGVTVLLDNEDWQGKLDRFIRAYPKTNPDLRKFAHVFDLRYSNGFVIKQKTPQSRPASE
jgi:Cell division septal protein